MSKSCEFLYQEIIKLRAEVDRLSQRCDLQDIELQKSAKYFQKVVTLAAEQFAKSSAEAINSLVAQLKDVAENLPSGMNEQNELESLISCASPVAPLESSKRFLVPERSNAASQNVNVDDHAVISASAVTESLDANLGNNNVGTSDTELSTEETSPVMSAYEVYKGSATETSSTNELVLYEETRQLSRFPKSSEMSLTLMERSVEEQARANDLKSEEIGLTKRKLWLKEMELALSYESNNLEKSKAAFRAEKFQTELEDTRKAEMVTRIMDWLVLGVFNMLSCMLLGAYFFSQQMIRDASSLCEPSEENSSFWGWMPKQVSSITTELNIWICRFRVWVQIYFGVLLFFVFAYFIIQRSSSTKQSMPVTFILVFLCIVCGISGKFCVDTLGGNGKLWLFLWEVFCLLQFVANVFALALYGLMYGPINVTERGKFSRCSTIVPYWARRSFFYVVFLFVLPAINGLLPFAIVVGARS